jgi:hypothetical protein
VAIATKATSRENGSLIDQSPIELEEERKQREARKKEAARKREQQK